MSVSWVCFLLPLAFALAWGEPAQGEEQHFRRPPPPMTSEQMAAALEASNFMWSRHYQAVKKQAIKAHDTYVDHLNKKYNTNYQKASGEVTHIMVENTMGRVYHMSTVLVKADCSKDQAEGEMSICEVPADAKKWECKGEVVQLYGIDTPYIHDEGCTEYLGPAVTLKTSSTPSPSSDDEEVTPYA